MIDLHLFQDYQKITESTDNESEESLGTTVKVVNKVIMHVQLLILLYYALMYMHQWHMVVGLGVCVCIFVYCVCVCICNSDFSKDTKD